MFYRDRPVASPALSFPEIAPRSSRTITDSGAPKVGAARRSPAGRRRVCADSGQSLAVRRMSQIDPKGSFPPLVAGAVLLAHVKKGGVLVGLRAGLQTPRATVSETQKLTAILVTDFVGGAMGPAENASA
jgi:hypothetical protein